MIYVLIGSACINSSPVVLMFSAIKGHILISLVFHFSGIWSVQLSKQRRVTVHDCAGADVVSIRDFHVHSGNLLPLRGENFHYQSINLWWNVLQAEVLLIAQQL